MNGWSRQRLSDYRRTLFNDVNGKEVATINQWPSHIRMTFWKKPMTRRETFMLLCFLIGNGCHPRLAMYWLLSSATWAPYSELSSRCDSINRFFRDVAHKHNVWFYYDLRNKRIVHLDGSRHNVFYGSRAT